jgi:hypothetical protein
MKSSQQKVYVSTELQIATPVITGKRFPNFFGNDRGFGALRFLMPGTFG